MLRHLGCFRAGDARFKLAGIHDPLPAALDRANTLPADMYLAGRCSLLSVPVVRVVGNGAARTGAFDCFGEVDLISVVHGRACSISASSIDGVSTRGKHGQNVSTREVRTLETICTHLPHVRDLVPHWSDLRDCRLKALLDVRGAAEPGPRLLPHLVREQEGRKLGEIEVIDNRQR